MKDKKLGEAGLYYSLTPKALAFVKGLEAIAEKHGVPKEDIPKALAMLAEMKNIE